MTETAVSPSMSFFSARRKSGKVEQTKPVFQGDVGVYRLSGTNIAKVASAAGGVMNSASTWAGITISAARRSRPVCSAQRATAWKSTTDRMMTALRLRPGAGANLSDEDIGRGSMDLGGVVPLSRGPIGIYLRKIHQAEPTTNIRLPARVESNGMWSFPRGCWQAG